MKNNTVKFLQDWCNSKYNKNIKQNLNFHLGNLDNPGWFIEVNGEINKKDIKIFFDNPEDDNDWISIKATSNEFNGYCSNNRFPELFNYFIQWITDYNTYCIDNIDLLTSMQKWYNSKCDGDWEHCYGFHVDSSDSFAWKIRINGEKNKDIIDIKIKNSDDDWIFINSNIQEFNHQVFECTCSNNRLIEAFNYAIHWVSI